MDTLQDRIVEAERRFDRLSKDRDDINLEMTKLQGEWRLLQDLLAEEESKKLDNKQATVIKAVPDKDK